MRTKAIIVIIIILSSVSCSSSEEVRPIPPDFIGTWVSIQDEPLDTYEFHEDGTGLMRDSSEPYTPVPFVYKFVDDNRIEFSAEEGHSIFVDFTMPSSKELSYDAQIGGYHIDFEKVDECQYETLEECIIGRWVRYWADGEFTFYDFYK
ncbi:MAG: hypothetical protein KAG66_11510, partial [Methylococcales bacterium]|nr:hypothetical protein [Methylococcales bacterium]